MGISAQHLAVSSITWPGPAEPEPGLNAAGAHSAIQFADLAVTVKLRVRTEGRVLAPNQSARDYSQGRQPCLAFAARHCEAVDGKDAMRAAKVSVIGIILTSFFLLAVTESRYATPAFGQAAAPGAPSIAAALILPPAPGQPQPFATIGALPRLAPAPGPKLSPGAAPTPGGLTFRCSCNGPGFATSWIGQVAGTNLLNARIAPTTYHISGGSQRSVAANRATGFHLSGIVSLVAAAPEFGIRRHPVRCYRRYWCHCSSSTIHEAIRDQIIAQQRQHGT